MNPILIISVKEVMVRNKAQTPNCSLVNDLTITRKAMNENNVSETLPISAYAPLPMVFLPIIN